MAFTGARIKTICTISGRPLDLLDYTAPVAAGGVAAGHAILLAVLFIKGDLPITVASVSDDAGNIYTQDAVITPNSGLCIAVFSALNVQALSAGQLITVTLTSDTKRDRSSSVSLYERVIAMVAEEWSGIASVSAVETKAVAATGSNMLNVAVGPTGTVLLPDDLIFTAVAHMFSSLTGIETYTPPTGYTLGDSATGAWGLSGARGSSGVATAFQTPSPSTGPYSGTWRVAHSGWLTAAIVAYKSISPTVLPSSLITRSNSRTTAAASGASSHHLTLAATAVSRSTAGTALAAALLTPGVAAVKSATPSQLSLNSAGLSQPQAIGLAGAGAALPSAATRAATQAAGIATSGLNTAASAFPVVLSAVTATNGFSIVAALQAAVRTSSLALSQLITLLNGSAKTDGSSTGTAGSSVSGGAIGQTILGAEARSTTIFAGMARAAHTFASSGLLVDSSHIKLGVAAVLAWVRASAQPQLDSGPQTQAAILSVTGVSLPTLSHSATSASRPTTPGASAAATVSLGSLTASLAAWAAAAAARLSAILQGQNHHVTNTSIVEAGAMFGGAGTVRVVARLKADPQSASPFPIGAYGTLTIMRGLPLTLIVVRQGVPAMLVLQRKGGILLIIQKAGLPASLTITRNAIADLAVTQRRELE